MDAVDDYKKMIDEVSRPLFAFLSCVDSKSFSTTDALKTWEAATISEYVGRVMNYNPAKRIKKEILEGTPNNATIIRRLEITDYELSQEALWQPQYQWQWNTKLFELPLADRDEKGVIKVDKDGNKILVGDGKPLYDALININGKKWAFDIMIQLEQLAKVLNYKVNEVEETLNSLYKFAGGNVGNKQVLPDILDTKLARTIFTKCIEKGWMTKTDKGFHWNGIPECAGRISQLAYMCGRIYGYKYSVNGNVGKEFPEYALCKLFGEKKLYIQLEQVYHAQKPQKWREIIDELFD